MPNIFISYRRSDTEQIAGRIVERLSKHFGEGSIFFDLDSIPVGVDYREHLNDTMRRCQVLLALIGEKWLVKSTLGEPRILNPMDPVRIEIDSAFENRTAVIPVLIGRAFMPEEHSLPSSFENFAYLNAARIDPGRDFNVHMDRLVRELNLILWADIRYEQIQEELKKIEMASKLKLSGLKNDASLKENDRKFLVLMWQLAAIDQKRKVLMDELLKVDEKESSSEKKISNVHKLRENIFQNLDFLNSSYNSLDAKRKEIQKGSEIKI